MKAISAQAAMVWLCASAAVAEASPVPEGPYLAICSNSAMQGTTLVAQCPDYFGNPQTTGLANADQCNPTHIESIDGTLRCVIAAKPNSPDHELFDVVSIPEDVKRPDGSERKTFRIDRPRVWAPANPVVDDFPDITFRPGDKISFNAGGCVQVGGRGSTWKNYVNPQGDNAPMYYSGTAYVRGVTGGDFQQIKGLMGRGIDVPKPQNPAIKYFLQLGYTDDDPSDNGYGAHDDGNNDQCKGIGPAFVEVTISRGGPVVAGAKLSPFSRPFDLVWDMNNEDWNGLPKNPRWAFQLTHKSPGPPDFGQPNYKKICGAAVTEGDWWNFTIDESKLAQICSSQGPTFDLHPQGAVCDGDPVPGHTNWSIASYEGFVSWEGWSGNGAYDDDYNLRLIPMPDSNAGLAFNSDDNVPSADIALEFDGGETVAHMGSQWWRAGSIADLDVVNDAWKNKFNGDQGLFGVVIGLIGLDSVHGGTTESHPVFAIAVRTAEIPDPKGITETWAFFLRNSGDEGKCGDMTHFWEGLNNGEYFIELPWPKGAMAMRATATTDIFPWAPVETDVSFNKGGKDKTIVRVTWPHNSPGLGVDGTFSLHYDIPGGGKKHQPPPARKHVPSEMEKEVDLAARITDRARKALFMKSLEALEKARTRPTRPRGKLITHQDLAVLIHQPGMASQGKLTRARVLPNAVKKQWNEGLEKVLTDFRADLKLPVKSATALSPATTHAIVRPVARTAAGKR